MAACTRCFVMSKMRFKMFNRSFDVWLKGYSTRAEILKKHSIGPIGNPSKKNRYIIDQATASNIAQKIGVQGKIVIEANPGPGVLTREMIKQGARKVIGLESDKRYLPSLDELQNEVGEDVFRPLYADICKIDPHILPAKSTRKALVKKPAVRSQELLSGLDSVDWKSDKIPVEFVGIEGGKDKEAIAKVILSMLNRIPTQKSYFEFGRCQFTFFLTSEKIDKLLAKPGSPYYNRMAILTELFCHVDVLHKEPISSFDPHFAKDKSKFLTLTRITPRKVVDIDVPEHFMMFVPYFIRIIMVKPMKKLLISLEGIHPGAHEIVSTLGWPVDIRPCDLTPNQFVQLIEAFFQCNENSQLEIFSSMFIL